jgi:hypothetical protein
LRKKLLKERDEEIEVLVSKFEDETTKSQNELKKNYEEKMNALKERNATQLTDVRIVREVGLFINLSFSSENQRSLGKTNIWN